MSESIRSSPNGWLRIEDVILEPVVSRVSYLARILKGMRIGLVRVLRVGHIV